MEITFVSGNESKYKEITYALAPTYHVKRAKIDLVEIQGDPAEIAIAKCNEAYKVLNAPVIVEDSSLSFNALGGMPGPYIKYFYESIGNQGLYKLLCAYEDKSAISICAFAYKGSANEEVVTFIGTTHGFIVSPSGTNNGFGWDDIFETSVISNGHVVKKRCSEMTLNEKISISPRTKALKQLVMYLSQ